MSRGGARTGAGRPAKRPRIEDCAVLDVRVLRTMGALREGEWGTLNAGAGCLLSCRTRGGRLFLAHERGQPPFMQLESDSTPSGFGVRAWLLCPTCGGRCMHLYRPPGGAVRFACRLCTKVSYPSQRMSPFDRADRRLAALRSQLSPDGSKPAGMLVRRYLRITAAIAHAQSERNLAFIDLASAACVLRGHVAAQNGTK